MIYFYSLLVYLISSLIPFYLIKRSKKNPAYKLFWSERFSINLKNNETKPIIWLHSVSVGETRAMVKLIDILERKHPDYKILITVMTPTGRETARSIYSKALIHYIPYDMPHAIIKFYKTFKPKIGLIMETEIWPNLIFYANKLSIPLYLINARLSDKSFNSYKKFNYFITPILNKFTKILCQDNITKDNFIKLGYIKGINVVGNTKFDMLIDQNCFNTLEFFNQHIRNKRVVIFSSTREGEEKMIIENIPSKIDYLIIIVPRHPERFMDIENLLIKNKVIYQKKTDNKPIDSGTEVFLGDTMGEMMLYYKMCDLAVIGGSFSNNGGQNLLEPIYLDKPVIFGSSMYNFTTIAYNALNEKCAIQVNNIEECFKKIEEIFSNQEQYDYLVSNCGIFIDKYSGASERIVEDISRYL
ncbi:MAG: 3-deoxy-D-manno-octulosonic acid transferase [Proteobacteria bacterium]|jgi:3-deoxy-D-manno-octulosonic-acid transferase|nr:3-deoxy-D-manno-octulosonic acid transferase [Pseudomonadota bacterium]